MTDEELENRLADTRQELFNLRFRARPARSRTPPA